MDDFTIFSQYSFSYYCVSTSAAWNIYIGQGVKFVPAALLYAIRSIFGFDSYSLALSFDRRLYTATNIYFHCIIKDKEKYTWPPITIWAICILLNLSSTTQYTPVSILPLLVCLYHTCSPSRNWYYLWLRWM